MDERVMARNAPDRRDGLVYVMPRDVTLAIEVALVTGRRNQIRLHAMLLGHPLVGEPLYRPEDRRVRVPFARQALHAFRLRFRHPRTDQWIEAEAPLPPDMRRVLDTLRIRRAYR